jgi:hypothetical protein
MHEAFTRRSFRISCTRGKMKELLTHTHTHTISHVFYRNNCNAFSSCAPSRKVCLCGLWGGMCGCLFVYLRAIPQVQTTTQHACTHTSMCDSFYLLILSCLFLHQRCRWTAQHPHKDDRAGGMKRCRGRKVAALFSASSIKYVLYYYCFFSSSGRGGRNSRPCVSPRIIVTSAFLYIY